MHVLRVVAFDILYHNQKVHFLEHTILRLWSNNKVTNYVIYYLFYMVSFVQLLLI